MIPKKLKQVGQVIIIDNIKYIITDLQFVVRNHKVTGVQYLVKETE